MFTTYRTSEQTHSHRNQRHIQTRIHITHHASEQAHLTNTSHTHTNRIHTTRYTQHISACALASVAKESVFRPRARDRGVALTCSHSTYTSHTHTNSHTTHAPHTTHHTSEQAQLQEYLDQEQEADAALLDSASREDEVCVTNSII